jgi:hypothetical protein
MAGLGEEAAIGGASGAGVTDPVDAGDSSEVARDGGNVAGGNAAEDGGAASSMKGNCGPENPLGCYRGMYVSLYTDHAGQNDFGGDTAQHAFILGDAEKEQVVLDFIEQSRIESLSLYDLTAILGVHDAELRSFVARARSRGVLEVNAIGALSFPAWQAIQTFQAAEPLFDGLVTEIEFWNEDNFADFLQMLTNIRGLEMQGRASGMLPLGVYIGWATDAEIDAMIPLIDRLYVHTYVTEPALAYDYGAERFQLIAEANAEFGRSVEIRPIFSLEGATWAAGAEHFMGDWYTDHSLDEVEAVFLADYVAGPLDGPIELNGFQYFDYFYLERYSD